MKASTQPKNSSTRNRAASIPPAAVLTSSTAADRELFDIEAKLRKLDPRMREAGRLHNEAEEAMARWAKLNSDPGEFQRELKRERAAWSVREKKALKECRFAEREAAWNKLVGQLADHSDEALEIRATTLAGVLCKARIAKGDWGDEDALSCSVVDDLLALQPKT
jgi:hypothetical protein